MHGRQWYLIKEVRNVLGIQISSVGYDYERIKESPIVTYILAKLEHLFLKCCQLAYFWVCSLFVKCYLLLFMWACTPSLFPITRPCWGCPSFPALLPQRIHPASLIFKWKVPDVITSSAKHHVLYLFIKHIISGVVCDSGRTVLH